jgi:hypothetical protein
MIDMYPSGDKKVPCTKYADSLRPPSPTLQKTEACISEF